MFEFESVKYEFSRVTTAEALEIRKIIMRGVAKMQSAVKESGGDMSNEADLDIAEMNEILCELEPYALAHLKILNQDGKTFTEKPDISLLESFFSNPFYAMAITSEFFKVIQGFLQSLPSYQNTPKAKA